MIIKYYHQRYNLFLNKKKMYRMIDYLSVTYLIKDKMLKQKEINSFFSELILLSFTMITIIIKWYIKYTTFLI